MNTEFIDRYGMLPAGTRVLTALSGGKDSVYLLHCLLELARTRELTVLAAHLHHGLRGAEADRDEAFVRNLCRKWSVPLSVGHADAAGYAREHGVGIEEACRELRYAFLESVREDQDCGVIATAHQAEDLAETMLLNLARGTGAKGLAGIPPVRGHIIRPILDVSEREIERYLSQNGIPFVEDSTNRDDSILRNRIRHQVLPVLNEINPRFVPHAAAAALSLREDDACLQAMAEDFLAEQLRENAVPAMALAALPKPVAARALRMVCGPALTRRQTEDILVLCQSTQRKSLDVCGMTVRVDQGMLRFGALTANAIAPTCLTGERGRCVAGTWRISWEKGVYTGEIHNSFNTFFLKHEKIQGTITVTEKRDGDRVRLAGRNCTKTLKALFQERKLSEDQRLAVPVIRDDAGVLAVLGFGMAERCLPKIGDEVICISCKE